MTLVILESLILIILLSLIYFVYTNEKKKKLSSDNTNKEIFQLLYSIQNEIQVSESRMSHILKESVDRCFNDIKKQLEEYSKNIRVSQDQANNKYNEGFKLFNQEIISNQKLIDKKTEEFETTFKTYSTQVNNILESYNKNHTEFKNESESLRKEIKSELSSILKEIKAPLDLD